MRREGTWQLTARRAVGVYRADNGFRVNTAMRMGCGELRKPTCRRKRHHPNQKCAAVEVTPNTQHVRKPITHTLIPNTHTTEHMHCAVTKIHTNTRQTVRVKPVLVTNTNKAQLLVYEKRRKHSESDPRNSSSAKSVRTPELIWRGGKE